MYTTWPLPPATSGVEEEKTEETLLPRPTASGAVVAMEELPEPLIVEILGRLSDARDLARCRLVSRAFRALSYLVHSVSIVSYPVASQHQSSGTTAPPFTALAGRFLKPLTRLESVRVAVDEPRLGPFGDGSREEDDDLFLVDVGFISGWIPAICEGLRSISLSSYWPQSCWRKSTALAVISNYCEPLSLTEKKISIQFCGSFSFILIKCAFQLTKFGLDLDLVVFQRLCFIVQNLYFTCIFHVCGCS